MLANLISGSMGMRLVRKAIETELKKPVPVFTMVYNAKEQKIFFDIPTEEKTVRRYPYENKTVFSAIELMTKKELKNNSFLVDRVNVNAKENDYTFTVYYRNEKGEKLFTESKLK